MTWCIAHSMVQCGPGTLAWNGLSGVSLRIFSSSSFDYEEPQGTIQTFLIPLNVTGKEKPNTVGEINSASFKNLGGVFFEERVGEEWYG